MTPQRRSDRLERGALAFSLVAIAALRFALRAPVPDDDDAIGFVLAVRDFDLARLQPHFPGYPVYVALCRVAHAFGLAPLDATAAVGALSSAGFALGLYALARRLAPVEERRAAGLLALALATGALGPWLAASGGRSDGTALGLVALAFAALAKGDGSTRAARWIATGGAIVGLCLGVRASYAPLALSWVVLALAPANAQRRRAAVLGLLVGVLAWAIPLVVLVGAGPLLRLGREHVRGHFVEWGGSIATEPDVARRLLAFARGLLEDGLLPGAFAQLAGLVLLLLARTRLDGRRLALAPPRRALFAFAIVTAPYAAWVLLGQNVLAQPRHLLPLVGAALLAVALATRRRPLVGGALAGLVALASLPLALRHASEPPAAAQAVAWLASAEAQRLFPPATTALFGGRAIRFFEQPRLAVPSLTADDPSHLPPARARTWLAEIDVDLERFDRLPTLVLVTSEVDEGGDPARAALLDPPLATFCRDLHLDRAAPCLSLRRYRFSRANAP